MYFHCSGTTGPCSPVAGVLSCSLTATCLSFLYLKHYIIKTYDEEELNACLGSPSWNLFLLWGTLLSLSLPRSWQIQNDLTFSTVILHEQTVASQEENRKELDSFSDASTGCAVAPVKSRSKQGALSCMTPLTSTASTPTLQGQQQETKPNLTKITLRWQLWGPLSPRSPCWSIKYLASWFQGPPTAAQMQVEHRVKDSSLVIIFALLVLVTIFLSVRSN